MLCWIHSMPNNVHHFWIRLLKKDLLLTGFQFCCVYTICSVLRHVSLGVIVYAETVSSIPKKPLQPWLGSVKFYSSFCFASLHVGGSRRGRKCNFWRSGHDHRNRKSEHTSHLFMSKCTNYSEWTKSHEKIVLCVQCGPNPPLRLYRADAFPNYPASEKM